MEPGKCKIFRVGQQAEDPENSWCCRSNLSLSYFVFLRLLGCSVEFFTRFGNLGSTISSDSLFDPFSLTCQYYWDTETPVICVWYVWWHLTVSEAPFIFLLFSSSFSYWIISVDLSPSSWIISSAWSDLLLSPSSGICCFSYYTF